MGDHIVAGEFQSDKYPTCPRGKVPLSVRDVTAQDLLWEYAQRRRVVDAGFSEDLEACLHAAGHDTERSSLAAQVRSVIAIAALETFPAATLSNELCERLADRAVELLEARHRGTSADKRR